MRLWVGEGKRGVIVGEGMRRERAAAVGKERHVIESVVYPFHERRLLECAGIEGSV
jgi:hypothetical protein